MGGFFFDTGWGGGVETLILRLIFQVLHLLPPGTHDWQKFISPEEVEGLLDGMFMDTKLVQGMLYIPGTYKWASISHKFLECLISWFT